MSGDRSQSRLSREEIAQRDIGHTDISNGLAWTVTVVFLLTIAMPPALQLAHDLRDGEAGGRPTCGKLFRTLPAVADVFCTTSGGLWDRVLAANRRLLSNIEDYEKQLADRSLLTRNLLGPTQCWLTELAGLGNEQGYVGRGGWLYFRPDVDCLTGPGFLEPAVLQRRTTGGKQHTAPPMPDPRTAILEFHEQLASRGIRLIVMPIPGKSAIHPEHLSSRFDGSEPPVENVSFEKLTRELQEAGVLVFDPAPLLVRRKGETGEQFLRTDTHWTPAAMQFIVGQLREFIERHAPLPPLPPVAYGERMVNVENLGDVAAMLHLPEHQTLFPRESVMVRQIVDPDGRDWESDESADVLLLGDSYTNIFSLSEMNWGAGAGLAEQLSFALRRKIDRLAQNDGGSHAVRQTLYQQLARGHDRLVEKRVVIWEFAIRELAFGDWKSFPMPTAVPALDEKRPLSPISDAGRVLVRGTVRAAAGAPQPGSVPYRDAVTAVHLEGVEGVQDSFPNREIVVYLWGLRDNRLTSAARFATGQKVSLQVVPWDTVREKYERFNRIELDDPDFRLVDLPAYWGEEAP